MFFKSLINVKIIIHIFILMYILLKNIKHYCKSSIVSKISLKMTMIHVHINITNTHRNYISTHTRFHLSSKYLFKQASLTRRKNIYEDGIALTSE